MKYGVLMFQTDYAMRPDQLARAAEEREFESLFFPEHTHIPVCRRTPWPGGGDLPEEYWHTHDLFVALAYAAAATHKIKIGTGICLVVERDPITLAKEVASLDYLSNGRLIFGIGGGWNVEEMENHGTDFKTRWLLLRERILAMKEIWAKDEAEYHGKFVNFDPIWSYPKPVQKPHPPVLLGAGGAKARQRVIDFCDGWLPLGIDHDAIVAGIRDLHERAVRAGRKPEEVPVTVFGVPADADLIKRYAEAGVDRVLFWLPPAGPEKVLAKLDRYAALAKKVG